MMAAQSLPSFISESVRKSRYFFLNLRPPPDAELTVVCGGRETCDPDYMIDRPQFPYFAIEYVADGQGVFQCGGVEYPLHAGSVFAYGPGLPHHLRSDPRQPMVKYFVDFTGLNAESLLAKVDLAGGLPRQLLQSHWFHSLFDQLIETGDSAGKFAPAHCRLLLQTMISRLRIDARDARQVESAAYETYTRCRRYAEQEYLSLTTTTQWSQACCLDHAYLSRLFKRYSSRTPYHFLLQLKMDHAADLLVRRGASVKQAAHIVGFDDPQHFSRVFKRVRGLSPSDFLRLAVRGLGRRSKPASSSKSRRPSSAPRRARRQTSS